MDRLQSSSSPFFSSSLRNCNLPAFLTRPNRFDSASLIFSPSTLRRATSISYKHENPSPLPISSKTPLFSSSMPMPIPVSHFPTPSTHSSLNQIASPAFHEHKAMTTRTIVILSAALVVMILVLQPAIDAPAAFATSLFQNASSKMKGGGGPARIGGRLISSAWTGFFAGCLHTLSGPDHLAALAPLSIGCTRMESAAVGALWGCGHDAGQLIFGLIFLLLKDRLHNIEIIQTWGTIVVGLTLLIIGAMGIKEASESQVTAPRAALQNGTDCTDVSVYESVLDNNIPSSVGNKNKVGFATFATGIVHGLQPDALMIVLPAVALPSRLAGVAFLIMFLLGTVIAMVGYTLFLSSCSQALKERVPRITEKLTWASSFVAIALGFAIIISQCFGFSLY